MPCEQISFETGGADGIRTHYLLTASQTLSRLSYSPAWFKNITKQLEKLKLQIQAQPLQYRAQTEISQVGQYHIFDRPPCPSSEEKPYPTKVKHAQKYSERVINGSNDSCQEENGFRAVAVNNIAETEVKAVVTISK